ncbi:MAG: hypothetical protein ABSA26_13510, partial [Thermoguttaceae bacterium]
VGGYQFSVISFQLKSQRAEKSDKSRKQLPVFNLQFAFCNFQFAIKIDRFSNLGNLIPRLSAFRL